MFSAFYHDALPRLHGSLGLGWATAAKIGYHSKKAPSCGIPSSPALTTALWLQQLRLGQQCSFGRYWLPLSAVDVLRIRLWIVKTHPGSAPWLRWEASVNDLAAAFPQGRHIPVHSSRISDVFCTRCGLVYMLLHIPALNLDAAAVHGRVYPCTVVIILSSPAHFSHLTIQTGIRMEHNIPTEVSPGKCRSTARLLVLLK